MNSEILDTQGAVEFLGITTKYPAQTLQRMVRSGKIRGFLVSRKQGYRFHKKALEQAVLMGGLK